MLVLITTFTFHAISKQAANLKMETSKNKTKCLSIAKELLHCKLALILPLISQIIRIPECEITPTQRTAISGYVKLHSQKIKTLECKTRSEKTCIGPIVTHGAETRTKILLTKRVERTTEMKTLRGLTEFSLSDRQRNTNIMGKCQTDNIVRWITQKKRVKLTCQKNDQRLKWPLL